MIRKTSYLELFSGQYRGRTLAVFAWISLNYFQGYGFGPFVVTLMTGPVGGLSIAAATLFVGIQQWLLVPYQYFCAFTLDRFGRKFWCGWTQLIAAALILGAAVVAGLGFNRWEIVLFVSSVLYLGTAGASGGYYAYAPEVFPTRLRAWGTAFGSAGIRLMSSFSAIIVASVPGSVIGLAGVFVIVSLTVALSGLIFLVFLPETAGRVLEDVST